MTTELDHIAVSAATLEDGVAWIERTLGVAPPKGGTHPKMGTHNHLLRLGDRVYLEVIAVDPQAPSPDRPRWFSLDEPEMQRRLAAGPRLIGWVARTRDIDAVAAHSPIDPGTPETMTRGALEWLFTVPADGRLREGGAFPPLIEWPADRPMPVESMPDLGCRLLGFEIGHPDPDRLNAAFDAVGLDRGGLVSVRHDPDGPNLRARIATPAGVVEL